MAVPRLSGSVPLRIAVLALLGTAAYSGALAAGVAWDDGGLLSANPAVRSLASPWRFFTDPWTISPSGGDTLAQYRPLRTLTYALQFAVFGGAAWGYHLVSILLHALAAFLVGRLADALFGRGGWLAAAIWLLHPAISENVLYLAAQGNLLCLDLALAALLCHLRSVTDGALRHRAAAVAATFAAMLAYEFGAVLPALLVIADLVAVGRERVSPAVLARRHYPYWLALVAFMALRGAVAAPVPRPPWWEGSWTSALLHQLGLWLEGWRLTLLPLAPKVRYLPPDVPAWAAPPVAIAVHLALAALLVRALLTGKGRLPAACVAWWYVAQAPTSNIIVTNLGYMFAPRFLFLALILPVAAAAAWLAARRPHLWLRAAGVAAALLAVLLIRNQAAVWQGPISLNREIIARNENDFGGHYTLGWTYLLCHDDARARREIETARRLAPSWPLTYALLGELEVRTGNLRAANAALRTLLELQPVAVEPKVRQAEIAVYVGEAAAARRWLATVGSFAHYDPYARARIELALARVELALGERAGVPARVERAVEAWPHTGDVLFESGVLLAYCGERERGRELLRRAAERVGRDYRERVGDFAWIILTPLRPLLPLTPPGRFASFTVPEVGP